jgi:hypothetical protein
MDFRHLVVVVDWLVHYRYGLLKADPINDLGIYSDRGYWKSDHGRISRPLFMSIIVHKRPSLFLNTPGSLQEIENL